MLNGSKVYFTGDFDSGNLEKVEQLSSYTVSLLRHSIELLLALIKLATLRKKISFILGLLALRNVE